MHIQNLILNWTQRMNLPLKVRSTALQLNSRLQEYFKDHTALKSLTGFQAACFKAQACIFLGCKCEDIHGHLDKIMKHIEDFTQNHYLARILEIEVEMLEFLRFSFDFTNLYQSVLAIKLLPGNESVKWEQIVEKFNKVLCVADLNENLLEVAASPFEKENVTGIDNLNMAVWEEIKNRSKGVVLLTDSEIKNAFSR